MHTEMARDDRDTVDVRHLIAAMEACGVSSAALARRLDVDDTSVYRWRKGQVPLTRLLWFAITHALGLPSTWREGDAVPLRVVRADDAGPEHDS